MKQKKTLRMEQTKMKANKLKFFLIMASVLYSNFAQAEIRSTATTSAKPIPDKKMANPDDRKGLAVNELLNPNALTTYDAQQTTGEKPLYSELFKPTLQEWIKAKGKVKVEPSGLIYEKDYHVEKPTQFIENIPTLADWQYFYRQSLHAELVGANAKSILAFTHSKNGKVFVSTRFNKVYDPKEFINETDNKKEYSQCVDISIRITVTNVPIKNNFGVQSFVDYWQDFEIPICHTNSDES